MAVMKQLTNFILVVLPIWILSVANGQGIYDYDVVIDHLELPENDLLFDQGTLRAKKYNRTMHVLDGYIILLDRITDQHYALLQFFSLQGNEYRQVLFRNITNLCTYLKNDQVIVESLIDKTSWAPRIESCPLKDGHLYFNNAYFDNGQLPVDPGSMKKGKMAATFYFNDKILSKFAAYFIIERTPKKRQSHKY